MTTGHRRVVFGAIGIGLLIFVIQSWRNPTVQSTPDTNSTPQQASSKLTSEHRDMIASALRDAFLPQPQSLEIDATGYLVATFEGPQPSPAAAQNFAKKALLSIRSAMFNRGVTSNYRVTMNGPSPGPGSLRYGTAEFSEGGSVHWEPEK